jgi:hypothetical protein
MKFNKLLKITPPPFVDNAEQIFQPKTLEITNIELILIDNEQTKTIIANLIGFPLPLTLWSGAEYDQIGDWTQFQAENRILELLGDNPEIKLRSLFPKTLEENPNHPGSVLAKTIKSLGFTMSDTCQCKRHALEMNDRGNDWCEENIETIVGWLREETHRRNLPFIDSIGRLMVSNAIAKSRKLLADQKTTASL